ncbi:DUF3995 domain-containing protein [Geodermatophilus sp. SYSU D01119]
MTARTRRAAIPAYGAAALALGSAGTSAYWTVGGTALLSTVGGAVEELARRGGPAALALGAATTAAKLAAAALALALVRPPARQLPRRLVTGAALAAGALLTAYGALQAGAGAAALLGLAGAPPADPVALRWHVLLWDPWFLLWGLLLGRAALLAARSPGRTGSPPARRPARPPDRRTA